MKKIFNQNLSAKVQKTPFDLSHERKLSMKMGELVPVLIQEVVPGDKFIIDTQSMIRFAPMVAPVMHRINAYIHYFYVPNRILWDGWEKFITGDVQITIPNRPLTGVTIPVGSLADHLGLPTGTFTTTTEVINMLPFYAYVKIFNEFYRDENLQAEIDIESDPDPFLSVNPLKRAWEKDYFTSALPWAQKGNPVTMDATVNYKTPVLSSTGEVLDVTNQRPLTQLNRIGTNDSNLAGMNVGDEQVLIDKLDNISSVSVSVEELRRATRLQRWLERNARSGSRYVEHLLSHWGVLSSDARLQRPEYIGGGKSPVVISEVLNTTGTEDLPQGNMAGHGINVGRTNKASKFCEEHGYIIGIMSVIPEPTYQQGLPKHFTRLLNLDFYYPEFSQLGEQEVLNKELMLTDDDEDNNTAFGYQSRYAEYKYSQSTVHGEFKTSLDYWHMGRKFATLPTLNETFISCDPTRRVFAVTDDVENLYVQLYHKITAIRPLPYFNDPKL